MRIIMRMTEDDRQDQCEDHLEDDCEDDLRIIVRILVRTNALIKVAEIKKKRGREADGMITSNRCCHGNS